MDADIKMVMSGSIPVGPYAMIYDIVRIKDASGRRFIIGQNISHPKTNLASGGNYDCISDALNSLLTVVNVGTEQAHKNGWISALEAMDAMQRVEDAKAGWELEAMDFEVRDILGRCFSDLCETGGNRKVRRAAKAGRRR